MNKIKINYIIDSGLAVSFIIVAITGIIKWPGLITKLGLSYQQLPYQKISLAHDYAGLVMAVLVLVHLILHWKWIICTTKNIFKGKECKN